MAAESAAIEDRVSRGVARALRAVSMGLDAYENGRIMVTSDDTQIHGVEFIVSNDLDQTEADILLAKLAPGWAAGLGSALHAVHTAREAAVRGSGPEVTWNVDRPRC